MTQAKGKKLLSEAKWLWPDTSFYDLHNKYAHFRKDFNLGSVEEKSMLYITADQGYKLWINGKYITRGPARGYQAHWPYDEVEVSEFLKVGKNYIAVEVYNSGTSTFGYVTQTRAGLICAGDFGSVKIRTDATWIARLDTSHKQDTALYSLQLNFQEHVDSNKDDRKWIYSEEEPIGWVKPGDVVNYGSMPWYDLEERGIPQLRELIRTPVKLISGAAGTNSEDYKSWRNIADGLFGDFKGLPWKLASIVVESGQKIQIPPSDKKGYQAVVLDMGETVVGPATITIDGDDTKSVVDIFYHECIGDDYSPVLSDPKQGCKISMANRLVLSEGITKYDFYQILGFRYVTLIIRENTKPVNILFEVTDTGYPYELKGNFECSDQTLNDIWKICRRTEQVCSLDAYVDTPWREQAQWWGDARIQFANTMVLDNDVRLFKRGIRSIAGQSVPNGLTYGHAPTMAHNCILPDFSLVWIMTIYDYYRQTKDLSLFEEQFPRIREVLSYFKKEAPKYEGLICYDERYWLFLDWSDLEKENGAPILYNMWYLMTLRTVSTLLKLCGQGDEAAEIEQEGINLQAALEKLAFDHKTGLFCDIVHYGGKPSDKTSVHSQTFAIMLDLMPEYHQNMMEKRILPFLKREKLEVPIPSTYWVSYVLGLAREKGYFKEVISYIKSMWAPMIKLSTCEEIFDSAYGESSCSHAWSAHPLFHLINTLGGIVQEADGWDTINFNPYFLTELQYVDVKVPTPYGTIESSWKRETGKLKVSLKLPQGIKAKVMIPGYQCEVESEFCCSLEE